MADILDRVHGDVAGHMDRILANFRPGAQITVVVCFPDLPDRDFVMTGGDLAAARDAIKRRIDRGHEAGGPLMARHNVTWQDAGRWATQPANPRYPNGVDLDVSRGALQACVVNLRPYPAPRRGKFVVECSRCGYKAVITTAGRRDDPRSVRLPCKGTVR